MGATVGEGLDEMVKEPEHRLPPIVHAPCERASFDPDRVRAGAADWIYINIDSPSQV